MKATGIVRKIDELGRVVIPKEIRKNLHIKEGDPLEIFIEKSGEIIFKKYAAMSDVLDLVIHYIDAISKTTEFSVCVTDTDSILAVAGASRNSYMSKEISEHAIGVMEDRAIWSTMTDEPKPILADEDPKKYSSQVIAPIICDGDAVGTIILFSTDSKMKITQAEYKIIQAAATFLGTQMES